MSAADYILGLLTIVTGLAISDMIVSLHGLLINRRSVKWDWLALLAATYVLVLIINTWRLTFLAFQESVKGPPIWAFMMILVPMIALYLAARTALPDRIEHGESLNLRDYYDSIDRYLWSALSVVYGSVVGLSLLAIMTRGKADQPVLFVAGLIGFPVVVALAIWPHRKFHQVAVPALFIWLCARVLPANLLTP